MSSNWSDFKDLLFEDIPLIPPIPPSPPLPQQLKSQTLVSNKIKSETNISTNSYDISSNTCSQYWNYLTKSFNEEFLMVSLYNDVESVIQMGPKCGLVALLMSQSLVCEPNKNLILTQNYLYETAKQMGFSKTGEMFSVENMAKLANRVLSVQTDIKDNLKDRINDLIIHLAKGLPVLVPYDSDANHEPTLLAGQRAHWAIILGFCIAIDKNEISFDKFNGFVDHNNPQIIHLRPKHLISNSLLNIINTKRYEKLMVYAKQGKSKHLHLWDFNKLCESNCNLVKTSRKLNESDIILPENGGIIMGLNNKCLFINNKS